MSRPIPGEIIELKRQGFPFKTFAEMSIAPVSKRWLIKGIFARGESSAWIAPPKTMKSALLAQAAICVGAGLDWHGHRSKEAAGVVYFALERADLVERRMMAHRQIQQLPDLPIVVCKETIDMTKPDAYRRVAETVKEAEHALGASIGLVIFDTFAKLIAAAGGDENSAKDQGAVFANVQRLKNATDAHVALIGHTGKDENRGARGSNAILGDADVMVMLSSVGEIRTATVTHANDAPEGPLFSFKSEVFEFGTDDDGDPITVNVVSGETLSLQVATKGREPELKPNQKTVFAILHGAGSVGLTLEDWNAQAKEAGIGLKRKADLTDIRNTLQSKKLVRNYGERWHVCHQ
ncbi:AAA family ATPase [Bradyrhizobium sp. AUGA SZCCT0182]|uniref:AAA family ATPase n=1 Tax=Bradyrhizobium sp. AUGA SZCCT0182 TaxID=2807667 RepID=UPI001BABB51D|nr:AAA family ATPase [Bradyrhizobium sp. AUGA SZCCT0182]MBR1238180.1 AAA family ATPase [Bradyrhizobium sp. AUGA SZCCT0182]